MDSDRDPFTPNEDDEGIFYCDSNISPEASITIGDQVCTLSPFMFSKKGITSITIPGTVTTIGNDAFYNCSKLYGVTLAHTGPPTLGDDAFVGTQLHNQDVQLRWIALEDGSDENVAAFKDAINWRYYAYIIKAKK